MSLAGGGRSGTPLLRFSRRRVSGSRKLGVPSASVSLAWGCYPSVGNADPPLAWEFPLALLAPRTQAERPWPRDGRTSGVFCYSNPQSCGTLESRLLGPQVNVTRSYFVSNTLIR